MPESQMLNPVNESDRLAEELRRSEERLRLAQRAARSGVWSWNVATGELYWSAEAYDMLGFEAGTVPSMEAWLGAVPPEHRAAAQQDMERARQTGDRYHSEFPILRRGELRWIEAFGDFVYDSQGNPIQVTGIGIDVTGRKRTEIALQQTLERLDVALRSGGIGTYEWQIGSGTMTWDEQEARLIGVEPHTSGGPFEQWSGRLHPEDLGPTVKHFEDGMRRGLRDIDFEYRIVRDGEIRWICGSGRFYYDAGGKPVRMIGFNQDITERKRTEQALRDSDERFRMATQAANAFIWDYDVESGCVARSEAHTLLYGRTQNCGPSLAWWTDRIHAEDRDRVMTSFHAAINGAAQSWDSEYRFRKADGTWANIYDRASIARRADGTATRVVGAMLDTTELNVARRQLKILSGLLPICAECKKIRDADGSWQLMEVYIHTHSEARFTHGLCPECANNWIGGGSPSAD
jgi:PAS domain S-box-containing protein